MSNIALCKAADIPTEGPLKVEVDGFEPIAVYNVDDEYFATSDTCTHMQASLSEEGEVEGQIVECTMHNCRFDIRTGEPESLPCTEALKTYPVKMLDGVIHLEN